MASIIWVSGVTARMRNKNCEKNWKDETWSEKRCRGVHTYVAYFCNNILDWIVGFKFTNLFHNLEYMVFVITKLIFWGKIVINEFIYRIDYANTQGISEALGRALGFWFILTIDILTVEIIMICIVYRLFYDETWRESCHRLVRRIVWACVCGELLESADVRGPLGHVWRGQVPRLYAGVFVRSTGGKPLSDGSRLLLCGAAVASARLMGHLVSV